MQKRPNLERLLRKWQKRLKLQDWVIEARYVKPEEMVNQPAPLGECHMDYAQKEAVIRILDPKYNEAAVLPGHRNTELTFVHEMMHCHLNKESVRPAHLEHVVEALAKAFMEI
jgi:hypothetical protein